jgi:uncharacterized protein (TIGR02145 family)
MKTIYFIGVCSLILFSACSTPEGFNEVPQNHQSLTATKATIPVSSDRIQIGEQIWMTKNLNVSRYRNGDIIPQVTDMAQWRSLTTGAWCYYENDTANGKAYGKLYNWYAVNDPRGLAPVSWHIPTFAEFQVLQSYLGGSDVAGGKMKTTTLWAPPNTGADNSSGFTAYPAAYRAATGQHDFYGLGLTACWWSSSSSGSTAIIFDILYNEAYGGMVQVYKGEGCSVRCIKD